MAKKLAAFVAFGCALAIFACARTASAQTDESPPAYFGDTSSESVSEDASGPALSTPADSENESPHSAAVNTSRSSNTNYGTTPSQSRFANTASRTARPAQNYNFQGQQNYQTEDRRSGANYQPSNSNPQKSNSQSSTAGNMPGYQQAPRSGSAANSSSSQTNSVMKSSRGQWPTQSDNMQSYNSQTRQQYGNRQQGYQQRDYMQPGDMQSGNMSASYMSSNNGRRNMQPGQTSSIMAGNSSPGSTTYGPTDYGSTTYRNPYSSNRFADNTLPSPMPLQSSMSGRQYSSNMTTAPRQPMVTPNAVYIDAAAGESIGPGRAMYGKSPSGSVMQSSPSMMESEPAMTDNGEIIGPGQSANSDPMSMQSGPMDGGPMQMGPGGDGFTNPYCNSCNGCGGGCGGPSCGGCMGGQCGSCCDDNCCDGDDCGSGGHEPYGRPWILAPIDWLCGELHGCHRGWWWAEDLTVYGGVQNFKNIADGGITPSFGFQEGVNWGAPLLPDMGLSAQLGYQAVQSEFENPIGSRTQSFVTAGVFHRPWCDQCWDAGIVFDWLHDDFFGAPFDVGQIRGQLGWQWNRRNEIGFWFGANVIDSSAFQTLDQYNFYYRRQFCRGGDFRIWGGFTGSTASVSGGMVGADFEVPLAKSLAIDGGFNYFIPSDAAANGGLREESWGLGCNLVWYLGGTAQCNTPYRPLFDVANNGTLMTILR